MKVTTAQHGEVTMVEVSGDFTWDSATRLTEAIDAAFKQNRRDFVVDLGRIETIDSTGLETLTALQRRCEEHLGMVCFCNPRPDLRKILELTRLDRSLTVHQDAQEALATFA